MKKLCAAALTLSLLSFGSAADAACPVDTACDTARVQANKPEHIGKKAATTQAMVCVHAVAHEKTELVLVDGEQPRGEPVSGDVITSWRTQASKWKSWPTDQQYVYREICFPKAFLRQGNRSDGAFRSALTLCNGTELNQPLRNRSVWRSSKGVPQLIDQKRRIGSSDPACLLGSEICAQYGL